MKFYVAKSRYEGDLYVTNVKHGYKNAITARRAGQKAAKNYIYVEVGQYDEDEQHPEMHAIDIYEYGEMLGGELLWDSLTQANLQALEEAPTKVGDGPTET